MSSRSDSIKEIGTALAKAQGVLTGAVKDSINPHFRNKYADLASCWDACRKALTSNGIAVVQMPERDDRGYYVETLLTHSSGEWIASKCYISLTKRRRSGPRLGDHLRSAIWTERDGRYLSRGRRWRGRNTLDHSGCQSASSGHPSTRTNVSASGKSCDRAEKA